MSGFDVGTRVFEPAYPDTLGTVTDVSPAGDGWHFVHFDGTTKGSRLAIPEGNLRVASAADEERVLEQRRALRERIFGTQTR